MNFLISGRGIITKEMDVTIPFVETRLNSWGVKFIQSLSPDTSLVIAISDSTQEHVEHWKRTAIALDSSRVVLTATNPMEILQGFSLFISPRISEIQEAHRLSIRSMLYVDARYRSSEVLKTWEEILG